MSRHDNHWSAYRNALFGWTATVPLRADAPRALLDWTLAVVELARVTDAVRFRKVDGTYWQWLELVAWLEHGLAERSVVDAFAFARRFDRTGSTVAYHDERGIHEELVDDVGGLLARLRAPVDDMYGSAVRRAPPLWVGGHAISFTTPDAVMAAARLPSTNVKILVECDLWLPWVPGRIDPADRETFYDNRALAERHTPRLNAFLAGLRESVTSRGGHMELTFFSENQWLPLMVGVDGIDLGAAAPAMKLARSA